MTDFAGPDRILFKYCSQDALRAILENRSLKWSRPTAFNDIFDAQIDFDLQMDADRIVETALARSWEIAQNPEDFVPGNGLGVLLKLTAPMLRQMGEASFRAEVEETMRSSIDNVEHAERFKTEIRELLVQTKILCFSEDPLSRPLWGHYSDSYQGAALAFRTIRELDSPYQVARSVTYSAEAPRLITEDDLAAVLSGESNLSELRAIDRFVFVKHEDWAWEKEWRLVSGLGRHPEDEVEFAHFDEKELASVLIGPRASDGFKQFICEIIDERYPFTAVEIITQRLNFTLEREVIVPPRETI